MEVQAYRAHGTEDKLQSHLMGNAEFGCQVKFKEIKLQATKLALNYKSKPENPHV